MEKNIGRAHWLYCERHGLKWCVGENLISSWQDETEDDWIENERYLMRLRETDTYHRSETLFERTTARLGHWRHVIVSRLHPASSPHFSREVCFSQERGLAGPGGSAKR
jgi:hypothetical protein